MYLRERDLLEPLDAALASAFAPHRLTETITELVDAQQDDDADHEIVAARAQLAACATKLARHRAALEAGADPAIVTGWIAEVEADRRRLLKVLNRPGPQSAQRMTSEQISALVSQLGDIVTVLRDADPADRTEVYRQLGLRLTYHPQEQKIRVQARPDADPYGKLVGVRGGT